MLHTKKDLQGAHKKKRRSVGLWVWVCLWVCCCGFVLGVGLCCFFCWELLPPTARGRDLCASAKRQPECRCLSRARRQRSLDSSQARAHCGMPPPLPPRSSVHRLPTLGPPGGSCASAPVLAPSPLNPLALRAASSTSLQPCRTSFPAPPLHAPVPAPILLPPTDGKRCPPPRMPRWAEWLWAPSWN